MQKNRSAFIYPVSREVVVLARFHALIAKTSGIDILGAVAPQGVLLQNEDVSFLDGGTPTGILISNVFNDIVTQYDMLILPDISYWYNNDYMKDILDNLMLAMRLGLDIYCIGELPVVYRDFLLKYAELNKVSLIMDDATENYNISDYHKIIDIQTPVVAVISTAEDCSKFQCQLGLVDILQQKGFRVSYISSKSYGELLGFHSFPSKILSHMWDFDSKIKYINAYMSHIEKLEKPDIFLIGIPGGVLPVDEENLNGYGLLHVLISSAINIDFLITNYPCSEFTKDYMKYSYQVVERKMGVSPDVLCLSNISINQASYIQQHYIFEKDVHSVKEVRRLEDVYKNRGVSILNSLCTSSYEDIVEKIIRKLS